MRKEWLKTDDDYLKNEYYHGKKEDLICVLKRSWSSITSRASKLGLKKVNVNIKGKDVKIWSTNEDEYLHYNYPQLEKEKIMIYLKRSWSSIQNRAYKLKINRNILTANSFKIINGSNEAYYWLGFIMADGHFSKTKQIQINLGVKDLEHLKKFATFVEYKEKLVKPSISIGYGEIKNELDDLLSVSNDKTHNPCDLSKLFGDSFFSFIIGFIDGDGCINTKGYLTIKCHNSWLYNLNKMVSELSNNDFNHGRINSDGLAIVQLTKHQIMKKIKIKANQLNLPLLSRKWDRVNLKKEIKIDKETRMRHECNNLFESGVIPTEIIKMNKFSRSFIYKTYQDYRNSIKEKDLKRESERNL
jgi:hypothetical protein